MSPTAPLTLDVSAAAGLPHVPYLRRHLPRAHALLGPALTELSLALVGNARMARLHEQFLGIPGPTDVLTFELDHDPRGRVTAGEVVLCVPHAVRQAKAHHVDVRDELLLYALHGMLHLCGYDDRTARDFAEMHQREDDILKRLGIGAIFAPIAHPSAPLAPARPKSLGVVATPTRRRTHTPGARR